MAFATSITFDSDKTFDISDFTIILTTIIKKSQLSNTNIKNRNKKKKNNLKAKRNNNNTCPLCIYSYYNKNYSPILKIRTHSCRTN